MITTTIMAINFNEVSGASIEKTPKEASVIKKQMKKVRLAPAEGTVVVGGTKKIKIKNAAKADIKYKSNKKSVATVSKTGRIKGLRNGSAKIKVTVKKGTNKTKLIYKITVKKPKISKKSMSLISGKTATLLIKNRPKKATYIWSSDNKKIATVDKRGKVTARDNGKAIIRVTVKTKNKKYNLSCNLEVKPKNSTPAPSVSPTPTSTSTPTPMGTATPTSIPTPTNKPELTDTPTPTDTPSPTNVPEVTDIPSSPDTPSKPQMYTVTFDSNGGSDVTSQQIENGGKAIKPDDPTKNEYIFGGWYTSASSAEKFNFDTIITQNITLYARWNEFILRSDRDIVLAGEDDEGIHLYLETNLTVDSIDLQYGTDNALNKSINMYDNGQDADDIAGDGVYSTILMPDITEDTEIFFSAKYKTTYSNIVNVMYYTPIAEETYEAIETVSREIRNLLDQPGFMDESEDEKIEMCQALLKDFVESKQVQNGSIYVDKENELVSFSYPEGILGGIMYSEYDPDKDGSDSAEAMNNNKVGDDGNRSNDDDVPMDNKTIDVSDIGVSNNIGAVDTNTISNANNSAYKDTSTSNNNMDIATPERIEDSDSYEKYDDFSDNIPLRLADTHVEEAEEIGNAVILNSFPAFETDPKKIAYRTDFYDTLKSTWDNSGLKTTLMVDPSVRDYKNLNHYNVICVSTHGNRYSWNDGFLWGNHHECPAICLAEKQTKSKDKEYQIELKSKQIGLFADCYCILPSFFTNQYEKNAFADSFVFLQCCESIGSGQGDNSFNYDYSMANAFIGRSAKSYIGYHNSVFSDYGREFMEEYIKNLIDGKVSMESFNSAIAKMGANHEIWYDNNKHPDTSKQYHERKQGKYDPLFDIAYPVHCGNGNAMLVDSELRNGGFERFGLTTTKPGSWKCLGDVRTLTKLGSVKPYGDESNRMAVITTGIGSQENIAFEGGTEGSKISQTFKVPEDASKIIFNYDFISEEPMEFVGGEFDDSFAIQVTRNGTTYYSHTYESINTSEWEAVSGIDFIGGDHTTFHTGWKTGEIDISAYSGRVITLSFIIYDVGDQIYDSACVIDNIMIQ